MGNMVYITLAVAALLLLYYYTKIRCFFRAVMFSLFSGALAFGGLWLAGNFINTAAAPTPFTAAFTLVFGVPGLAGLLIFPII